MTLSALITLYFVHLAAAISPGPAVLMAARVSLQQGMARGAWLALGIGLGACIWALAALFGLAVVFKLAPVLLTVLKFGGAAYLSFIGYKMWRHASEPLPTEAAQTTAPKGTLGMIWQGIAVQLANPKPAVFFGAIFIGLVPPAPSLGTIALILAIILFNDGGWNVIVARIFSLERTRRGYLALKTTIDRIFGALLILLALNLIRS